MLFSTNFKGKELQMVLLFYLFLLAIIFLEMENSMGCGISLYVIKCAVLDLYLLHFFIFKISENLVFKVPFLKYQKEKCFSTLWIGSEQPRITLHFWKLFKGISNSSIFNLSQIQNHKKLLWGKQEGHFR